MPLDATCLQALMVALEEHESLRTRCQTQSAGLVDAQSSTFQRRTGRKGRRVEGGMGGGLREEQKRRSPTAPVIGLPRLSFPRDQSHRNCLLPDCSTNQLLYRPLNSCFSSLFISPSIYTETPVVVVQPGGLARGGRGWGRSWWKGLSKSTVQPDVSNYFL